jgi:hypothetical protein
MADQVRRDEKRVFEAVTPDLWHLCKTCGSAMPKNKFFGAALALKVFPESAFSIFNIC